MIQRLISIMLICMLGIFNFSGAEHTHEKVSIEHTKSNDFFAYYTRTDFEEKDVKNSGLYADIVVNLNDKGKLIFSRETSYRPVWYYNNHEMIVEDLAGTKEINFDKYSKYTYARIIESSEEKVVIHWRYFPDLNALNPTDVVHELFTIYPDGAVERVFKKGTESIDQWNNPNNHTLQTFKLTTDGIKKLQTEKIYEELVLEKTKGNPINKRPIEAPVLWLKLDEGLGKITNDTMAYNDFEILGHTALWKEGVSGTALGFDGYFSKIEIPHQEAPVLSNEFTLDLWTVVGAYPYGEVPLVDQSFNRGDEGYFFGINEAGKVVLRVENVTLTTRSSLEVNKWYHLSATCGDGKMEIYVNGQTAATKKAPDEVYDHKASIAIGLNKKASIATDPVRENFDTVFGLEGLIDEVKIYDRKLSDKEVRRLFRSYFPGMNVTERPDIEMRTLPGLPGKSNEFGASYKKLAFHDLWDNMWRVDPYSDIIVKFDDKPTSYVYWRGTTHGVNMVTENNLWMSDQSVEVFCENLKREELSLSEHMSDKQSRFSHVRILENTDARVVIHWRYATGDLNYEVCSPNSFVDEYHTIYPDGTLYRTQKYWATDTHDFADGAVVGDLQPLTSAGKLPTDIVNKQALSTANGEGVHHDLIFDGSQFEQDFEGDILMVNFKSDWKVFTAFNQGSGGPWGKHEQSKHSQNTFAGPWNHWPISQLKSDGRYSYDKDGRINHFALSAGGGYLASMYGFSNQNSKETQDITTVIPAVKAWREHADVVDVNGAEYHDYDIKQKAYNFTLEKNSLSFNILGTHKSPIINPCFVIKNWNSEEEAIVKIDSKIFGNVKQGVIRDVDGSQSLVLFLPFESEETAYFEIIKASESGLALLNVEIAGTGRGTVFIETESMDGYYEKGTDVLLYAVAADGSRIKKWHGEIGVSPEAGNSKEQDNYVRMDKNKTITVEFETDFKPTEFKATGNTDPNDRMKKDSKEYITVTFEDLPTRLMFLPPASAIMATENNIHYLNGWAETYDVFKDGGSFEPNMDGDNKHARMWIESQNDARVVVRWRAALMSQKGIIAHHDAPEVSPYGPGDWVDEKYTIYPDGTYTRKSKIWSYYANRSQPFGFEREENMVHEFQEMLVNRSDGVRCPAYPDDDIHTDALTLIKMNGDSKTISYSPYPVAFDQPEDILYNSFGEFSDSNIFVVNTKSKYHPYTIGLDDDVIISPYGPEREELQRIFQAWPNEIAKDGAYHAAALGHIINKKHYDRSDDYISQVYLSGWTASNEPAGEVLPIAKSWLTPPEIVDEKGVEFLGYNKVEKAYLFDAVSSSNIEFTLLANQDQPLVNPAFIIKDYHPDMEVSINGQIIDRDNYKVGYYDSIDIEGEGHWNKVAIIYLELQLSEKTEMMISPK